MARKAAKLVESESGDDEFAFWAEKELKREQECMAE